jgi:hypothetical protein
MTSMVLQTIPDDALNAFNGSAVAHGPFYISISIFWHFLPHMSVFFPKSINIADFLRSIRSGILVSGSTLAVLVSRIYGKAKPV